MQFALDTYMEAGVGNSRVLPDVRMHGTSGCLIQPVFGSQGMVGSQKTSWCVGQACRFTQTVQAM